MHIGLQIPNFTYPGGVPTLQQDLKNIVQTADQGGFYSIWVMDHFFQIQFIGPAELNMLEGYSALSYFAGITDRVKLGTLVTGVVYRHPGVLVKTASTLSVLSGGRAYLGIGAAWNEQEALGLGIPFPPTKVRFEMLEETLQIAHKMFADEATPFDGKHFKLAQPINHPLPLSKPPILIGGGGEQKTLRLVAQYADACNLFARMGDAALQQKLDALKAHCDKLGRDYNAIEKTALNSVHLAPGQDSAAGVIRECEQLAKLGFSHIIFNMPNTYEIKPLEVFAKEIIPAVAGF